MPGPAKQFPERINGQLAAGMLARVDAVRAHDESRADLLRHAIEMVVTMRETRRDGDCGPFANASAVRDRTSDDAARPINLDDLP